MHINTVCSSQFLTHLDFSLSGPWASEKTPLLQRTNDQARFLGAKSFIDPSYYTSEYSSQRRRSSMFSYAKSLQSNTRNNNINNRNSANEGKNKLKLHSPFTNSDRYSFSFKQAYIHVYMYWIIIDQNGSDKERKKLRSKSTLASSYGSSSNDKRIGDDEISNKPWHWTRSAKVSIYMAYRLFNIP